MGIKGDFERLGSRGFQTFITKICFIYIKVAEQRGSYRGLGGVILTKTYFVLVLAPWTQGTPGVYIVTPDDLILG